MAIRDFFDNKAKEPEMEIIDDRVRMSVCANCGNAYIDGDRYFKINSPDHNLVRTRCQIALARDMERKMEAMDAIVKGCVAKYRNASK